jgi:membrane protease YdiL (CAAX protease family)
VDADSSEDPPVPPAPPATTPTVAERTVALVEVLICSDYPTQLALSATFAALGYRAHGADGKLSIGFIAALSFADSALLIGLVLLFLVSHGERPRDVLIGSRPILGEARAGIPMIAGAFLIAIAVLLTVRGVAPWLRTVEHNPLQDLLTTRQSALLFALVVIVAGGIREEIQRAFLLHRFERWLGGPRVGVIVASTAFGIGHFVQGADAVLATTLLGIYWSVVYLRRRSVVAPMVSHTGFDLLQVVQFLTFGH